ncbi:MAG: hypothetical protein ACJ75M_18790 [Actinomycetes bacterium]
MAVSADKIERLRSALNDDDPVQFLDISVVGRNPGPMIQRGRSSSPNAATTIARCAASESRSGPNADRTSWSSRSTTSR